jgi:hypothetical protein
MIHFEFRAKDTVKELKSGLVRRKKVHGVLKAPSSSLDLNHVVTASSSVRVLCESLPNGCFIIHPEIVEYADRKTLER